MIRRTERWVERTHAGAMNESTSDLFDGVT